MTTASNKIRKTDAPFAQPIQTSRYLEINDDWFFFTREKDLLGPYRTRVIAEHAVKVYIDKMEQQDGSAVKVEKTETMENTDSESASAESGLNSKNLESKNNVFFFKDPDWNF